MVELLWSYLLASLLVLAIVVVWAVIIAIVYGLWTWAQQQRGVGRFPPPARPGEGQRPPGSAPAIHMHSPRSTRKDDA